MLSHLAIKPNLWRPFIHFVQNAEPVKAFHKSDKLWQKAEKAKASYPGPCWLVKQGGGHCIWFILCIKVQILTRDSLRLYRWLFICLYSDVEVIQLSVLVFNSFFICLYKSLVKCEFIWKPYWHKYESEASSEGSELWHQ